MRDLHADLYLRISHGRPGTGLDVQEQDCRHWAELNGLVVREVHVDLGRSGFKQGVTRPGFDRAVTAIASGAAGTLVVWKLDRLSRRGAPVLHDVLRGLDEVGGRLVSVQEALDSSEPTSRVVMEKLADIALAESENLSLRVRSAKHYLRAQGRWIGGAPSYGLVVRDGRLAVDPLTGPTVREIARRVMSGDTLTRVTEWLNSEGIAAPRGGLWNVGTVSQLLRGPATAGLLPETITDKRGAYTSAVRPWSDPQTGSTVSVMADGEPPLISPADRQQLVALLDERSARWPGKGRGLDPTQRTGHLLTGVLRCSGCGSRMSRTGNSYRCQAIRLGRSCPAPASAHQKALEEAVTHQWADRLSRLEPGEPLAEAVVVRWNTARSPQTWKQLAVLTATLELDRDALAQVDEERYVHGTLTVEEHELRAQPLVDSILEIEHRIDALSPPIDDLWSSIDVDALRAQWAAAALEQKKALLALALVEVWVSQGVRGRRFEPGSRLAYVWATSPPTVTGDNESVITAAKQHIATTAPERIG